MALTALGSTSWALLHPSSWAGEPVGLGQVPPDEIMFVAILGFLGLLLLHGVETGVAGSAWGRRDRFPCRSWAALPSGQCAGSPHQTRRQPSGIVPLVQRAQTLVPDSYALL